MRAYLGLGANLGDREVSLTQALVLLQNAPDLVVGWAGGIVVTRSSSIYETAPWGYTQQPDFLNCVFEVETRLSPVALLRRTQGVEQAVGRQPSFRYGPRLIDVDILLYGGVALSLDQPDLQLPHPRLAERAFVLTPLAELAGELVHPVLRRSMTELALHAPGQEGVLRWGPPLALPI